MSAAETGLMSGAETRQMSPVETGQMFAAETGQMSAVPEISGSAWACGASQEAPAEVELGGGESEEGGERVHSTQGASGHPLLFLCFLGV